MKKLFLITCILFLAMATTASTLVSLGNELIRINPENNRIEASTNQGRSWMTRYSGSFYGEFQSLTSGNGEILATTTKGLYASRNGGRSWMKRS